MAAIGLAGTAAFLVIAGPQASVGFALGAGLAILGFYWLHQAVVTVLDAKQAGLPKGIVGKLLVRYPLGIAVVFIFYETHWLPVGAVLAGLFVPVAGAMAEGIFLVGRTLGEKPLS